MTTSTGRIDAVGAGYAQGPGNLNNTQAPSGGAAAAAATGYSAADVGPEGVLDNSQVANLVARLTLKSVKGTSEGTVVAIEEQDARRQKTAAQHEKIAEVADQAIGELAKRASELEKLSNIQEADPLKRLNVTWEESKHPDPPEPVGITKQGRGFWSKPQYIPPSKEEMAQYRLDVEEARKIRAAETAANKKAAEERALREWNALPFHEREGKELARGVEALKKGINDARASETDLVTVNAQSKSELLQAQLQKQYMEEDMGKLITFAQELFTDIKAKQKEIEDAEKQGKNHPGLPKLRFELGELQKTKNSVAQISQELKGSIASNTRKIAAEERRIEMSETLIQEVQNGIRALGEMVTDTEAMLASHGPQNRGMQTVDVVNKMRATFAKMRNLAEGSHFTRFQQLMEGQPTVELELEASDKTREDTGKRLVDGLTSRRKTAAEDEFASLLSQAGSPEFTPLNSEAAVDSAKRHGLDIAGFTAQPGAPGGN